MIVDLCGGCGILTLRTANSVGLLPLACIPIRAQSCLFKERSILLNVDVAQVGFFQDGDDFIEGDYLYMTFGKTEQILQ